MRDGTHALSHVQPLHIEEARHQALDLTAEEIVEMLNGLVEAKRHACRALGALGHMRPNHRQRAAVAELEALLDAVEEAFPVVEGADDGS